LNSKFHWLPEWVPSRTHSKRRGFDWDNDAPIIWTGTDHVIDVVWTPKTVNNSLKSFGHRCDQHFVWLSAQQFIRSSTIGDVMSAFRWQTLQLMSITLWLLFYQSDFRSAVIEEDSESRSEQQFQLRSFCSEIFVNLTARAECHWISKQWHGLESRRESKTDSGRLSRFS
jgi:hypothetical protein